MRRILFGLERLPRTIALDDARLPGVTVGGDMLRLNTEPLPTDAMPAATGDHAARVEVAGQWLISLCGDYAPLRRQFIGTYFRFLTAELAEHRTELAERLNRYDGLYSPDDWFWSAPRPLPRAWLQIEDRMIATDIAFWDGTQAIAVELAARDTDRQAALRAAGITVCRVEAALLTGDPARLARSLPDSFRGFWQGETLPRSPFRRPIPRGVVRESTG